MIDKEEIVKNLSKHYTIEVMRAFGNIDPASKAIEIIATSLQEIYRYFEPNYFKGKFLVCKNFQDDLCYEDGTLLYDKNILLSKINGLIIIQVFDNSSKMMLWEDHDPKKLLEQKNTLIYQFCNNQESFFANGIEIDITLYGKGSRFSTQFINLNYALQDYSQTKILRSSCNHFSQSWKDSNRLFFRGGGRGSNIPEKFMQMSLYEYLKTVFRGITMEPAREGNLFGNSDNPKPVDIKISWREANRIALIEVKFIGTVKKDADGNIYRHDDSRANEGISQLKGYHDKALSDYPTTIIKSYLVVIDGRRNNLTADMANINLEDGMYYKDVDIVIDEDKKYHETIIGFERPIRMFVEPICS